MSSRLIIDHAVPIRLLREELFREKMKEEYSCRDQLEKFLHHHVRHAVLTAAENERLDKIGLKSNMPNNDWLWKDPYARYKHLEIGGTDNP